MKKQIKITVTEDQVETTITGMTPVEIVGHAESIKLLGLNKMKETLNTEQE